MNVKYLWALMGILLLSSCLQPMSQPDISAMTMGGELNKLANGDIGAYNTYKQFADKCVDEAIIYINVNIGGAPHFKVKRYGEMITPYADCLRDGGQGCKGKQVIFRYLEYSGNVQTGDRLGEVNAVWCDTKNEMFNPTPQPCSEFGATFDEGSNRCVFR